MSELAALALANRMSDALGVKFGRDVIGCCTLQNSQSQSLGTHVYGSNGACSDNSIALDFPPETSCSPGGRSGGALGPGMHDSRLSPVHCTSLLPFSSDEDQPPPSLPRLPPKADGGGVDGRMSFISLSGSGLVSGNSSSRDMRVGLLRRQQLSATSTTSSSSYSSSSSSSLTSLKCSLEVQTSKCPIAVGGPAASHSNLHQNPSSSSLLFCAAKTSTNSLSSQQSDQHLSPPRTVFEEYTDSDHHHQQYSSSSSESCGSSLMSLSRISPMTGSSHSAHLSSRLLSPSVSSTPSSSSSSSSSTTCNFSTVHRSKERAFTQPPIAVACLSLADLVLLNEKGESSQRSCPDSSSKKAQVLEPLQMQESRVGVLDPDLPLMRLGRSSGQLRTTGVVYESKSRTLPQVGGDMSNLRTASGATITRNGCVHANGAVPTLTFGSFQHGSGNYLLTDSDEEDSSDGSHGNRNSFKVVQHRLCMGIPRPLTPSFIKSKHLKCSPPLPRAASKANTRSVVGQSSVIHTSCSKGSSSERVMAGCDSTASNGTKEKRTNDTRYGNGNDSKQVKQGKYRFPDPFESGDIRFCKRVSQLKSLVAQTIRWEQNKQIRKHS